ncbi:MAG: SUMF1/EgtB/PvdO family nonheme iron enzyme [Victivallales bacterium]|nr:SUMF1/EgtB/PvdO family nonheme iron enzyme [Victivallales bacterium]
MTESYEDDNHDDADSFATSPHSDETDMSGGTQPHSDDIVPADAYNTLPPGDLSLLNGKYLVQNRCEGGMGVVYECVKKATKQVVALKTVLSDGPMTLKEIEAMQRNYDRVHELSHDHIVRVNALEVDEASGQWYVEMDWVDGENLKDHLSRFHGDIKQTAKEAVRVLRQVAEALDYAHGHNVIHRDVKDANIMVKKTSGNAVLIDFGIAGRIRHAEGKNGTLPHEITATTTTSLFAGTRGYQSPEQWQGKSADAASDEYSLAVTAYRCLSGHLPFWSANEGLLQEMVLYDDVPSIRAISASANTVLKKALAKEPSERYGSCKAFIDELERGLSVKDETKAVVSEDVPVEKDTSFTTAKYYILAAKIKKHIVDIEKRDWDRGQTFGDHLEAFETMCEAAKMAESGKDLPTAYSLYIQAEDEWRWIEHNQSLRKSAAGSREKARNAREAAVKADAERRATADFQEAEKLGKMAESQFETAQFEDSGKVFVAAETAFMKAAEESRRIAEEEKARKEAEEAARKAAEKAAAEKAAREAAERKAAEKAAAEEAARKAAEAFQQQQIVTLALGNGVELKLVKIAAGSFMMGSPLSEEGRFDNEKQHKVTLTKDFWLGRCPVTQGQYEAVMGNNPSYFKKGGDYPVETVSWHDAMAFCKKVTEQERGAGRLPAGYEFTLPTEAQWEYACRAGTGTALYSGGIRIFGENNAPALDGIAWYGGNSSVGYEGRGWDTKGWKEKQYPGGLAGLRLVGMKSPNAWGLYDMLGNVYEWCRDWYGAYPDGNAVDPKGPTTGSRRMSRGGSWSSGAGDCRSANRGNYDPSYSFYNVGFRLALAPVQ